MYSKFGFLLIRFMGYIQASWCVRDRRVELSTDPGDIVARCSVKKCYGSILAYSVCSHRDVAAGWLHLHVEFVWPRRKEAIQSQVYAGSTSSIAHRRKTAQMSSESTRTFTLILPL